MLPPGPRRPEALQSLEYGFDPYGFFSRGRETYGDLFSVRVLRQRWVVLADPDDVRTVFGLGSDDANSGEANLELRPLIGTRNVLLLDGAEHLRRRRFVLPPFHGDRMRAYGSIVAEATDRVMASWPLGRPFAVAPSMHAITFEVILRAVFGVEDAARLTRLQAGLESLLAWTTDIRAGLIFTFLGPDRMIAMRSFARQVAAVDEEVLGEIRRRRTDPDLASRSDVLTLLLQARGEDGEPLDDQSLRDELVTLLVAGHETTAALLTWAVHELAREPAVVDRLAAGEDGLADAVVNETLRLWPPVPLVVRILQRPMRLGGRDLPSGTTVAPCPLLLHRRPELWPSPERFLPDRFAGGGRPRAGTYLPFGGGVRRCVGAAFASHEARLVLSELARRFVLEPASRRRERVWRRGVILVPARGARVVLTPR